MKYFLYSILSILATVVCFLLVNPWAPIFCDEKGYLPNWLKWVGTFDDTLDAGIRDGIFTSGSRYWNRVRWLNRNPGYGFDYYALGILWNEMDWKVIKYTENPFCFHAGCADGNYNKHFICNGIRVKIGMKAWNMYDSATGQWKKESWGPEKRIPFSFSLSRAK